MELRNDIQKLAIWYIPIAIASIIVSGWYSDIFKEAMVDGEVGISTFMNTVSYIATALHISVRLVVAIWLYYMVSKTSGNKYIWFFFGLVGNLFALVIFIGVAIYENTASNKSLNLTGAENAPPS